MFIGLPQFLFLCGFHIKNFLDLLNVCAIQHLLISWNLFSYINKLSSSDSVLPFQSQQTIQMLVYNQHPRLALTACRYSWTCWESTCLEPMLSPVLQVIKEWATQFTGFLKHQQSFLINKLTKYVWNDIYGIPYVHENSGEKFIKAFEMCCYRRFTRTSWILKVRNEQVLENVREQWSLLKITQEKNHDLEIFIGHDEISGRVFDGRILGRRGRGHQRISFINLTIFGRLLWS